MDAMTTDHRRTRVVELVDQVINWRDASAIPSFTSAAEIAATLQHLLDGFSDLHFDLRWTVAEDRRVIAFIDMTGTHDNGPWLMVPEPTGRTISASLMLGLELDDAGMIVDSWLGSNFIAMLDQLGWGVAPKGAVVPS